MDKDRQTISATELSKFIYCPYQWYYERLYGRKELRKLALERNERLGLTDKMSVNFARGASYHSSIYYKSRRIRGISKAALVVVLAMLVWLIIKEGGVL